MTKRRLQWGVTTPKGKPLLIDGVIAIVDDETGAVSLDQRAQEVVAEVLRNDPIPSRSYLVPGIDLAHEVHRLIQDKHEAGIGVHDPLPSKKRADAEAAPASTARTARYNGVIDAVLASVYSEMQRLSAHLTGKTHETIEVADLRHGRLGKALSHLAEIATGDRQASLEEYFDLVDYIERFLSTTLSEEDRARFDDMIQAARPPALVAGAHQSDD
jgi:hypothetical protein